MARSSNLGHEYNTRFYFTFDKIHRCEMKTLVQAVCRRRRLSENPWVRPQASPCVCGGQYSNET